MKVSLALFLVFGVFAASATALQRPLLSSPVYIRPVNNWAYVYVDGAPKDVKECKIKGFKARVESAGDDTVSFCSLTNKKAFKEISKKKKVLITVRYANGRVRNALGKVTPDGVS